jgi:hypothetical protein
MRWATGQLKKLIKQRHPYRSGVCRRFAPRGSSVRRPSVYSWFVQSGSFEQVELVDHVPIRKNRRSKNNEEMLLNKGEIFAGVFFHLFTFVLSVCVCVFVCVCIYYRVWVGR